MEAYFIKRKENSTIYFTRSQQNGRIFVCGEGPDGVMIPVLSAAGIYQTLFLFLLSRGALLYNTKPKNVSSDRKQKKKSYVV